MRCALLNAIFGLCLLASCWPSAAVAAVPSDQLFPAATKGYLAVPNLDTLEAEFGKTQWGQMVADPVMKPFAEDLKRQLQRKWAKNHEKLGLTWDDVRGVPSGEVGFAKILISPARAVTAVSADVTGKLPAGRELMKKIDANLKARRCTVAPRQERDVTLMVYTHPKKQEQKVADVTIALLHEKQQQLIVCDDLSVALAMVKRFDGPRTDSLSESPAYRESQSRCRKEAGGLEPHLRWFMEPFGFAEAQRLSNPESAARRRGASGDADERDMLKILRSQGFTCVQGLGGFINFNHGEHDILHRTMAYAPPVKSRKRSADEPLKKETDKYRWAARMLNFPNGGDFTPPKWIPRDLATYVGFNGELQDGFIYCEPLVDAMANDRVYEQMWSGIKHDLQLDVRDEIVAQLGQRVLVISDNELPITADSERLLVAIEIKKDEATVAKGVQKFMKDDETHAKRRFGEFDAWEVTEPKAAPDPKLDIKGLPAVEAPRAPKRSSFFSSKAVAVARGFLLIATDNDMLQRVLQPEAAAGSLASSVDYKLVQGAMSRLGATDNSAQTFSRTDEEYRTNYEMMRAGTMPRSRTVLAAILNDMFREPLTEDEKDKGIVKVRPQQFDCRKLPEYDRVRRYLGPAGIFVNSLEDGWFVTGFFLSKQSPRLADAARSARDHR